MIKPQYGEFARITAPEEEIEPLILEEEQIALPASQSFDENLVTILSAEELRDIGITLNRLIDKDFEAQGERDKRIEELIEFTHSDYINKEEVFKGACGVKSTLIQRILIRSVANAMAEIFRPSGPVDAIIRGDETPEIKDCAKRVVEFFNCYLTEIRKDYYPDKEQMIWWSVAVGSGYSKVYIDPVEQLPVAKYINPKDIALSGGCSSIYDAERITHAIEMTEKEYYERLNIGMFNDAANLLPDSLPGNESGIDEAISRSTGIDKKKTDEKKYYLRECYAYYYIAGDPYNTTGQPLPYIFHIGSDLAKVVGISRNWREGDPMFRARRYIVQYPFAIGPDSMGLGLCSLALGNTKAATSMTQALIDAGYFANTPGGLKLKSLRADNNDIQIAPGEWKDIDPVDGLSINEMLCPMPAKEPSQALAAFRDKIENETAQMIGANETSIAEMNPNAPVGTILAQLEQAERLQSGFLQRIHRSLNEELSIFYELFEECLPKSAYPYYLNNGEHFLMKEDFSQRFTICPVADPYLISSTRRTLQATSLIDLYQKDPEKFDGFAVYEYALPSLLPGQDLKGLMRPPPQAATSDPLQENALILMGREVKAAFLQDHDAHLGVHQSLYSELPVLSPQNPQFMMILKAHILDHLHLKFFKEVAEELQISPEECEQLLQTEIPIEIQNSISAKSAEYLKAQEQAEREALANQPPPPDPTVELLMKELEMKQQEIAQRSEIEMTKIQLEQEKVNNQRLKNESDMALAQMKMEYERELSLIKLNLEDEKIRNQREKDLMKLEQDAFQERMKNVQIPTESI